MKSRANKDAINDISETQPKYLCFVTENILLNTYCFNIFIIKLFNTTNTELIDLSVMKLRGKGDSFK